jgi:acetyl-CoA decarbonylase/synthase, CODH/ACS complex subunit gamma
MAISGIQIYKMLPQTNCKDCGFPTCLAFAMKLAAKQVELSDCPHVSEESKTTLAESASPPIRLVSIKSNGHEAKAGNEVVLFRHEKTFYNKGGLFIQILDTTAADEIQKTTEEADSYNVNYVGIDLFLDGFAVINDSGNVDAFAAAVKAVRAKSSKPLILVSESSDAVAAALKELDGENPLISGATSDNWEAMAELAKEHGAALAATAATLDELATLTEQIKSKGVEDIVLEPAGETLAGSLAMATQIRRLSLKNFRALGYPMIAFPSRANNAGEEIVTATQAITKYVGFTVLSEFVPANLYPLLVLRENIYTDPQKPIQVTPGIYEINDPSPDAPLMVTTNFSITYFSVANEIEGAGLPGWLLVTDAEGMSVLTAWAAGKFDGERIAKAVKEFNAADKVSHKTIILPGHVAVLSGDLEEELPGWNIKVGPREAVDIPSFMKEAF